MGNSFCCLSNLLVPSDWVQIFGILVNAGLAVWIVCTIQNKQTNKRILKDHFISEIKEIRNDYRIFLNSLYSNHLSSATVLPWFKLMSIKIEDLMALTGTRYSIDKKILSPYQNDLIKLITDNEDFISQFKNGKEIVFSEKSKAQFIKFQQDNAHLFNEMIIKINDAN
jgi:hypothetical protein